MVGHSDLSKIRVQKKHAQDRELQIETPADFPDARTG
jgi:hypothetical protein